MSFSFFCKFWSFTVLAFWSSIERDYIKKFVLLLTIKLTENSSLLSFIFVLIVLVINSILFFELQARLRNS